MKTPVSFFCLIASFFFLQSATAQGKLSAIQGDWIKYKAEMRETKMAAVDTAAIHIAIKGNEIGISNGTNSGFKFKFTLTDTYINTGVIAKSGYIIEKVANDSLVLLEDFGYHFEQKRLFMVNRRLLNAKQALLFQGRDTLLTSKNYTPMQKKDVATHVRMKLKNKLESLNIYGTYRIHVAEKKIEIIVAKHDAVKIKEVDKIIGPLLETFSFWDLEQFQQYKIVDLPFSANSRRVSTFTTFSIQFNYQD